MKILFCGDSPTVSTGFGIVSKNLLKRLSKHHEIVVHGINHFGEPYDQKEFPYRIYPQTPSREPTLMYGYEKLWSVVDHEKPDLLFFLNDPWVINDYLVRQPREYPYLKMMAYFPTDGGPIKKVWMNMLNELDAAVCYSKYAEGVVTESNGGKRPDNLYQIYHGVDTESFKPVVQAYARLKLGLDPTMFIVGMVARNQYRKRFDILMKSFAEFAAGKDHNKVKLYLHTSLADVGFDITELAEQLGIDKNLILTKDITPANGVTDQELNLIYNAFSVNALFSLGDGFGLPVAESMATQCPQLVSDHSCLKELVDGHGGLTVKTSDWLLNTSQINTWGGLTDYKDGADKLELLYNNEELRLKLSEEAFSFITQPQFSWDYAADEFNKIIKNMFHLL